MAHLRVTLNQSNQGGQLANRQHPPLAFMQYSNIKEAESALNKTINVNARVSDIQIANKSIVAEIDTSHGRGKKYVGMNYNLRVVMPLPV